MIAATAKSLQSCPTLCDPIDGGPPGSPFPGILQARTLEWVAVSFSNSWKWKVKVKSLSRVWLFTTPWTAAYQAPLPMGFSRQEYWSGVPLPYCHTPLQSGEDPKSVPTRSILTISCQIVAITWQLSTFYFCQRAEMYLIWFLFACPWLLQWVGTASHMAFAQVSYSVICAYKLCNFLLLIYSTCKADTVFHHVNCFFSCFHATTW